jgi:cell division protein FtsB
VGRALLEVTAVATEADFGKSLAGIGKTAGGLIDARQAEKAKDEEFDRLKREQAVLEAPSCAS